MATISMKASALAYEEIVPGYRDDNGDYHDGTSTWIEYCRCDIVPAGQANQIALPDGGMDTYTYTVYNLPRDCREFRYGENVRLTVLGKRVEHLKVKGFHRYQLQCKMWV